ncbi:MAG: pyridoxal-phosphate dependent enzyme [Gemmatimonadetes bacterium]|nr:pyridoxal-phosphate dependent enzyme [Gemmatimonadota bacterium]
MSPLDLQAFQDARRRVSDAVHHTPLLSSRTMGERIGRPVLLKAENLQKTGAFKVRGALNRVLGLSDRERAAGVVTISAGNHAQAVAWASARAGVESTVVMPENATRSKVEASRGYGARVVLHGDVFQAFEKALELAEGGLTLVHPFDHPDVVAGQGTVGLEILDDVPEPPAAVVVPVGGGGLCSGVATALALAAPGVPVWGVEPEGADAMSRSLEAGRPVRLERVDTVADGLGAPMAGDLTYPLIRDHAAGVVIVSDAEIGSAMEMILSRAKLLVEPAGAAAVAALLAGRIPLERPGPVVAILSGGNVDLERLPALLGGAA